MTTIHLRGRQPETIQVSSLNDDDVYEYDVATDTIVDHVYRSAKYLEAFKRSPLDAGRLRMTGAALRFQLTKVSA